MNSNDLLIQLVDFIDSRKDQLEEGYKNETSIQKLIEVQAKRDELVGISEFLLKKIKRLIKCQ